MFCFILLLDMVELRLLKWRRLVPEVTGESRFFFSLVGISLASDPRQGQDQKTNKSYLELRAQSSDQQLT
jgi:hypothetical protein